MSRPQRSPIVLLVEDDDNDVVLIRRLLDHAGVIVDLHLVRDGEQAISYLVGIGPFADRSQHPLPDLMLLDLKMPRRTGHEVLAWVRQQEDLKRLPIAVLTSSTESDDMDLAYKLGATSYLLKPVMFDALADIVKTLYMHGMLTDERPMEEGA